MRAYVEFPRIFPLSLAVPRLGLVLAVVLCTLPCRAAQPVPATLGEMFSVARENEPNYLGAEADLAAARARKRQAVGALLPHLDITADRKFHRRRYKTLDSITPTARDRYTGEDAQLQLDQPIWHYADIAALHEARQDTQRARFLLDDTEQKLFTKIADAWFDLLEADDAVRMAEAKQAALQAKAKIATHGARTGLQGEPEAASAQAEYLQAHANELAAEMERQAKLAALEQYVGPADDIVLPQLRDGVHIPAIVGNDLDALLGVADSDSPAVQAAQRAVASANANVSKQRAGHQPTLDLIAGYGNNNQNVGNFPGQSGYAIYDAYVGLQLNIPLYAGGTQSAKVKEAIAQRDKARQELAAARRTAQLDVKTAYFLWHAERLRAPAAAAAMQAKRGLLEQARAGTQRGLSAHADVLEANQHWVEARSDWRKACYEQLRAYAKLRAAVGDLTPADAMDIDRLFDSGHTDLPIATTGPTSEAPGP